MTASEEHNKAMELCDEAFRLMKDDDHPKAVRKFKEALAHELVALKHFDDNTLFLGYYVLSRSAATLAIDAGDLRLAEQLATTALSKDDPEQQIVPELRDVLMDVYALMGMDKFDPEYALTIRKLMETDATAVEITNFARKRGEARLDSIESVES